MKILVTANKVPFMPGGADYHIAGLVNHLRQYGHQVEEIRLPFKFSPEADIKKLMDFCDGFDLNRPNGTQIDKVISLQFPGYGVKHADHTVWLMHQHRAVYELFEQQPGTPELTQLKEHIVQYDNRVLKQAKKIYSNSRRVSQRLQQYNRIDSEPLYHPPFGAEHFFCERAKPYIFCPSRLERLKRQDLLIKAAQYFKTPVAVIIAGDGGQKNYYQNLIDKYRVADKVRLIGTVTETEKHAFYAYSLAVFFAPFDEDYGYITLEAMLSAKPVITCHDSGGPLEFVKNAQTGYVLNPDPKLIAKHIDRLYEDTALAEKMGNQGLKQYKKKAISWDTVIKALTNTCPSENNA
jgi:glycosyltransferase involved in cell wall biosynthesis